MKVDPVYISLAYFGFGGHAQHVEQRVKAAGDRVKHSRHLNLKAL